MSMLFRIAHALDRAGHRDLVARVATFVLGRRKGQRFAVSPNGAWINSQQQAVIVSPTIHTTPHAAFEQWVCDNWCWSYLPREGDVVVDVGAGVGEEAVIFSRLVGPTGRVISIEAHPATFACLEQTVQRSGLANVTPLMIALGDSDGVARIGTGTEHLKNSILVGSGDTEVPMRTLCSVLREQGLTKVDLLKMNVEGAERLAVGGMKDCAAAVRHLVISCHDFLAERGDGDALRTREAVGAALRSFGYSLRTRPDHRDPWVRDYWYATGP